MSVRFPAKDPSDPGRSLRKVSSFFGLSGLSVEKGLSMLRGSEDEVVVGVVAVEEGLPDVDDVARSKRMRSDPNSVVLIYGLG